MLQSLVDIFNALIGALQNFLEGMSYIAYEVVLATVGFLDFDPFDELIDKYNPHNLIGPDFTQAWGFACHWLPIRESGTLLAAFMGVLGFCVLFRACLNWIKTGASGGGSQ